MQPTKFSEQEADALLKLIRAIPPDHTICISEDTAWWIDPDGKEAATFKHYDDPAYSVIAIVNLARAAHAKKLRAEAEEDERELNVQRHVDSMLNSLEVSSGGD